MQKIVIRGGNKLKGTVEISGAKNAVLPMMAASLLTPGKFLLRNVPRLKDVDTMAKVLGVLGATVEMDGNEMRINTTACSSHEAPYELVKTMRASVYVLGPLLARFGKARVSLPGGCAWGPRPVDLHIKGMKELGAKIRIVHGYIEGEVTKLKGKRIRFSTPSVGATGNVVMAAATAAGTTVIENAAREPEIAALADFLNVMGARISGHGTETITIDGVDSLGPAEFTVIPDRIEAGTFLVTGAVTGGTVRLKKCNASHLTSVLAKLEEAGTKVLAEKDELVVSSAPRPRPIEIGTAPYPGFPTDMQAQMMALLSVAGGTSVITDNIYFDRFTHVAELRRLGADIALEGNAAKIRGVEKLSGAPVMATDLRASAALIIAGLIAEGETHISRVYHIDRGYEKIEQKLMSLGADIRREEE
ncbi:MAG: UDP-N-acetylglucosamine 1-carboxyvinyltransferase [Candidatus Eisenbacteria bacterium]|nr:UDP-N-acetylglucosamine 1-carboxyvinyltransferase [Candidatus Eisenbacteria bacterium]